MPLESIAHPTTFTLELALLLIGLYSTTATIAAKLRSMVSMMVWGIAVITFLISVILPLDFIMVWVIMIVLIITEMFSMGVYAMQGRGRVA